ncbi:dihydrofolate reductase [Bacillus phage v_B-Bak6]|uniref:dihydrofolate reductase n=2 Tax=Basiliskvirus TaxID=3044670 RepID=A0A385IJZ7_9CAUD|nr:dihydrofolate reductase [Bacillus phage Basilisk]YP_010656963.1 dihydrofolate reductase [Bacillus phage v_B-Bak10]AXY83014.1 dihydrofolate reductase [Bacillus phage v_B-Bak1]AXY83134.1 dihydrofolate reductase [Bacillus phage v_B-Bak6]AGR46606.1 dihydrofolate reductase [Bacillus phage Basilisk]AXY83238.1 dihydrofolate reductase [Bacillus phage v_B-Bak10]
MIKMILACDLNGVIGNNRELPWGRSLPYDLNRFKELTEGHIVVMGRKTFESLGSKPLPNRENVVLSRSILQNEHLTHFNSEESKTKLYHSPSVGDVLDEYDWSGGDRDLWIIGGLNVYEQFMPYVQEIYLTVVKGRFEGDTKIDRGLFIELDNNFNREVIEYKMKDKENKYGMTFVKYTRIKGEYN